MIKTSDKITREIIRNQKKIYGGAISLGWNIEEQVAENYSEAVAKRDWKKIREEIRVGRNDKILDLGCGYGFFVAHLRKHGYNAFGCDTDSSSVRVAKELFRINKINPKFIVQNKNNSLPYKENSFDLINLNYVLVYAKDLQLLFSEIKRVLKEDGRVYLITPNYQCCYDVNYGLFLLPWLPKKLNKIYLKIMGRENTVFFDTFNLTTKRSLEKMFASQGFGYENVGLKKWLEAFGNFDFTGRSPYYRILSTLTKKLKVKSLWFLLARLGFYTPLIYILSKKG